MSACEEDGEGRIEKGEGREKNQKFGKQKAEIAK
jgi:hypothetical protein